MANVTGHHKGSAPKRGALHKITIEKAANGFSIQKHHAPSEGSYGMGSQEPPAVFTKHAPAHKHLKNLMAQMHPPEPTSGDMDGDEPMPQQA